MNKSNSHVQLTLFIGHKEYKRKKLQYEVFTWVIDLMVTLFRLDVEFELIPVRGDDAKDI